MSTSQPVIELNQATAADPTAPPPASLLRLDVSLMGIFTVLLTFYLTTNTCNLTPTIPTLLYRQTEDEFYKNLAESLDDTSNGKTVSINNVANPDISSICYVALRLNYLGNLVYSMRYVKFHLPNNMSYPTSVMSLPPASQWERVVEYFIKRLLATHVFGRFAEFPKKAKTAKYGPMIVTHFFVLWPFVAKFLEANCSVARRETFVTEVLEGSTGTIMRELARDFKITGSPNHYPIHMEGNMVLKLDLKSTPGLTPDHTQKKDDDELYANQRQIVDVVESEPYVDVNNCHAKDRSVNGVLLPNNAVLHYRRPDTSSNKRKLVKDKKTGATSTGRNLPDGAMYITPTSSILQSGIVTKRGKTRKDKPANEFLPVTVTFLEKRGLEYVPADLRFSINDVRINVGLPLISWPVIPYIDGNGLFQTPSVTDDFGQGI